MRGVPDSLKPFESGGPSGGFRRAALFVTVATALAASVIIAIRGATLDVIPIDGCYYLAKAQSFAGSATLRVPWGNGLDTKFFPGLSLLFAPFIKIFGPTAGWIIPEILCFLGCVWLTALLAGRLGLHRAVACFAATAFAFDPLVIKWASVPYGEIPATFFSLAAVEFAFRARESAERRTREIVAALSLGVAATMRIEAFVALPAIVLPGISGRTRLAAFLNSASLCGIAFLPMVAHFSVMATAGVGPGRIHYVQEFFNNFSWTRYGSSLFTFLQELVHIVPASKQNLVADMPEATDLLFSIARALVAIFVILGSVVLIIIDRSVAAGVGLTLMALYVPAHAFWHYADARFLVVIWPVQCAAFARGMEYVTIDLAARVRDSILRPVGIVTGIFISTTLLYSSNHVASAHAREWSGAWKMPARELAARIDLLVSPGAEGFYEFEMDFKPRIAAGPYVAMYRNAPASFAYKLDNFFEPHVAPGSIPDLLKSGNRFTLTNLTMEEWLRRRVTDRSQWEHYRAVIEERGHTVIIYKRPA